MAQDISRRDFLKLSLLGFLGAGFSPRPPFRDRAFSNPGLIGRITTDEKRAPIYRRPSLESEVVRETSFDELIHIYKELQVETGDQISLWYRVWGGYLHSPYVQKTYYKLNTPLNRIPDCGQLAEVTVPYTQAYTYTPYEGWKKSYHLYYASNHWITGIQGGPDGLPWYQITSELSETLIYYVPREGLRPITNAELAPHSLHVPAHEKRIEISLAEQTLTAFEYDELILHAPISSGLGSKQEPPEGTRTPTGNFNVTSKLPSKHMGYVDLDTYPQGDIYTGVPWVTFFIYETGVAIHGTYWHNNFGHRMSHGCINMRNQDAKWIYHWTTPVYDPPYRDHCDWAVEGRGTKIVVR
ncbi:MAG: hypothetical protein MAG431_01035 [Chloroflexi bacterium]|nr:hypothetical protein [Chloroflexota bacterium]